MHALVVVLLVASAYFIFEAGDRWVPDAVLQARFQRAQERNDTPVMFDSFKRLVDRGVVSLGMTYSDSLKLLGEATKVKKG